MIVYRNPQWLNGIECINAYACWANYKNYLPRNFIWLKTHFQGISTWQTEELNDILFAPELSVKHSWESPKSKLLQIPSFVPFDFSFFSSFQRPKVSQDHSNDSFYSFPWKAKGKQTFNLCLDLNRLSSFLLWYSGICIPLPTAFFSTHSTVPLFLKVSSNILSSHFLQVHRSLEHL